MPLCTLHLLSLTPTTTISSFLSSLRSASLTPIIQSKVIRWIILPKALSTVPLLAHNTHWDLLILLPGTSSLPISISSQLAAEWHVTVGIPSRLLKDFAAKNNTLLNPPPGSVKPAEKPDQTEASSTQNLELTPELASWIDSLPSARRNHPISMLNLLAFVPGRKEEYLKYGAAFAKSIGSRHGGEAKIVGNVIHQENTTRKADLGASANEAAAAGYMIPSQAASKSSRDSKGKGASASGASASGLMIGDEAANKAKDTRSSPGISASEAHRAAYKIPDEAQHQPSKAQSTTNADAFAAGYMIPSSFSTKGASASAAPSSGLMVETESSPTPSNLTSSSPEQNQTAGWDEIAIAHYPSLHHFAAMAGSTDYQSINHKHRVPSLRDTFILCTMEIGDDGELIGGRRVGAKL
ncbi:hypothetical protein EG328_002372 [Venturia inaequalis]|uniref:Uncharacterized protein n=1 Tax=Venturia inaequalis TaxID=5025 RepID=A0A8H3UUH7_VENIN|nr:hypothetical protein EG328_002372 [Venturia inaequalis]RDI77238.1 Serine/threonine-protein kinase [Venturia inaequalis]